MGTKVCKACGRELPETDFPISKGGTRISTCKECRAAAMRETRANRRAQMRGGKTAPFSDADFDNLSVGEVVRLMGRAKKWLESRNCRITLYGDFIETKTKKLKFE